MADALLNSARSEQADGNWESEPHINAWNGQRTSDAHMNQGVRHGRGTVERRGDRAQRRYGGDRGNHYFPLEAIDRALLSPSETTSICPWKGTANYYHLTVNGAENRDAVWYYADPKPAAAEIKGRVAFWKGVEVR